MTIKMRRKELKDLTFGDLYGYQELVIERESNKMNTITRGWDYSGSAMCGTNLKSCIIKRFLYEINEKSQFIDKCVESVVINPNNENYQKYKKLLQEVKLW